MIKYHCTRIIKPKEISQLGEEEENVFSFRFVVQTTEGKTSVGSKISLSDGRQMFAKWGIRKHNKYLDVRHPQRCNDMHKMGNWNSTISCYPPPPTL
jgi:hypothetical protein